MTAKARFVGAGTDAEREFESRDQAVDFVLSHAQVRGVVVVGDPGSSDRGNIQLGSSLVGSWDITCE